MAMGYGGGFAPFRHASQKGWLACLLGCMAVFALVAPAAAITGALGAVNNTGQPQGGVAIDVVGNLPATLDSVTTEAGGNLFAATSEAFDPVAGLTRYTWAQPQTATGQIATGQEAQVSFTANGMELFPADTFWLNAGGVPSFEIPIEGVSFSPLLPPATAQALTVQVGSIVCEINVPVVLVAIHNNTLHSILNRDVRFSVAGRNVDLSRDQLDPRGQYGEPTVGRDELAVDALCERTFWEYFPFQRPLEPGESRLCMVPLSDHALDCIGVRDLADVRVIVRTTLVFTRETENGQQANQTAIAYEERPFLAN
jgi:hypothetical protein